MLVDMDDSDADSLDEEASSDDDESVPPPPADLDDGLPPTLADQQSFAYGNDAREKSEITPPTDDSDSFIHCPNYRYSFCLDNVRYVD